MAFPGSRKLSDHPFGHDFLFCGAESWEGRVHSQRRACSRADGPRWACPAQSFLPLCPERSRHRPLAALHSPEVSHPYPGPSQQWSFSSSGPGGQMLGLG